MSVSQSDVLEKVRKLLALAESSNEHEAAVAAGKAAALMALHGIEMVDVTGMAEASELGSADVFNHGRVYPGSWRWMGRLAQMVAKAFRCEYSFTTCDPCLVQFYGRTEVAKACAETFAWIRDQLIRLLHQSRQRIKRERGGLGRNYNASYLMGANTEVRLTLERQMRETLASVDAEAKGRWELAKVDEGQSAMLQALGRMPKEVRTDGGFDLNPVGFLNGKEDGAKVTTRIQKELG